MEKIITFIVDNWKLIAQFCVGVFCLVMFLVRKKPIKVVDSLYQEITELLIAFIDIVEKKGYGAEKRAQVLSMLEEWFADKHPEVDFSVYLEFASNMIEDILSTPQKKGEK